MERKQVEDLLELTDILNEKIKILHESIESIEIKMKSQDLAILFHKEKIKEICDLINLPTGVETHD
jgi:hypothetical protein